MFSHIHDIVIQTTEIPVLKFTCHLFFIFLLLLFKLFLHLNAVILENARFKVLQNWTIHRCNFLVYCHICKPVLTDYTTPRKSVTSRCFLSFTFKFQLPFHCFQFQLFIMFSKHEFQRCIHIW